jgi:D-mannonate dehydratase
MRYQNRLLQFYACVGWVRTDLRYKDSDGTETILFDYHTFAAFGPVHSKEEAQPMIIGKHYPEAREIIRVYG